MYINNNCNDQNTNNRIIEWLNQTIAVSINETSYKNFHCIPIPINIKKSNELLFNKIKINHKGKITLKK